MTIFAITDALKPCGVSALRDDSETQDQPIEDNGDLPNEGRGMKCHDCIKTLYGMRDEERRRRKSNLNRMKKNCKNCKWWLMWVGYGGFHCNICDQ